jgi:hypothetical protein
MRDRYGRIILGSGQLRSPDRVKNVNWTVFLAAFEAFEIQIG